MIVIYDYNFLVMMLLFMPGLFDLAHKIYFAQNFYHLGLKTYFYSLKPGNIGVHSFNNECDIW